MTSEPRIIEGDCLDVMREMEDNSVDLVFCSPPYEDARTYDIDYKLRGQDWVDWASERFHECVRVSRGLVGWVVEGRTRQFQWSATPVLLMADLHRSGVKLRKPPIYHRVGIPGGGGPDWWRNDYEFIVCASKGRLPWSDNAVMGEPPKYAPGGAMSHRMTNGSKTDGYLVTTTSGYKDGDAVNKRKRYRPPEKTNPGNVISVAVGGNKMGSKLAHENEAPFPESLAEFFVRSFCPPGGTVLDPFCGSGTTLAVAKNHGRNSIGIDVRESQVELTGRRLADA